MAISFTWGQPDGSLPGFLLSKDTSKLIETGTARIAPKNTLLKLAGGSYDGKLCVELKRGAYTEEELAEIDAKAQGVDDEGKAPKFMALKEDDYGIKWRLWIGARPTEEQMRATEWDQPAPETTE